VLNGDPLTDITATRRISSIWRSGTRTDRHAFVGSSGEQEELAASRAQVETVMAAARQRWPDVETG